MQSGPNALSEAEQACRGVLDAILRATGKGVEVDKLRLTQLVAECRAVRSLVDEAIQESEAAAARQVAETNRQETGRDGKSRVAAKKQGAPSKVVADGAAVTQGERKGQKSRSNKRSESEVLVPRENPARAIRRKLVIDEDEIDDEGEDEFVVPPTSARKRQAKEHEQIEAVIAPQPAKKAKLKNGGVTRGPKGELVFYVARGEKSVVECPVYGKEQEEEFERLSLVPCDFDGLKEDEQDWACRQLCQVYADHIKRATRGASSCPLDTFMEAHAALQQRDGDLMFVNEHANGKGANPDMLGVVRNAQQLLANTRVCVDSIYYMMTAKLHDELSRIVEHGELMKEFRSRLAEMCRLYDIKTKPSTLERYVPAGKMMLKCQALAFVNITLLVDQHKATEKLLEHEERRLELAGLAGADHPMVQKLLPAEADLETVACALRELLKVVCGAIPYELEVTRINKRFGALEVAKVLRLSVGEAAAEKFRDHSLLNSIIWEYASIVNKMVESVGVKGWCTTESFRESLVPKGMHWIAVACCDVGAGVLLNWVEKTIIVHSYERSEPDSLQELVKSLVVRLKFPKKGYQYKHHAVNGYEDIGMLHWLSRIVWAKGCGAGDSVELLRLQLAFEFLKLDLIPRNCSFLDVIRHDQEVQHFEVEESAELNVESLMRTGFVVVRGLVPKKLCSKRVVSELCQSVKQSEHCRLIFQGAHHNDGRRLQATIPLLKESAPFSEALGALLDAVSKGVQVAVPFRSFQDMNVLVSLDGCGQQRPHCDYTPDSLSSVRDDGFCGGLPLGVVVALQPDTVLDVWPGALAWDASRFYAHQQLKMGPGDAVFFLGNSVHAGAAFAEENIRLHVYLESAELQQQRVPDTTHFMDIHAGVANILPRGVTLLEP